MTSRGTFQPELFCVSLSLTITSCSSHMLFQVQVKHAEMVLTVVKSMGNKLACLLEVTELYLHVRTEGKILHWHSL